MAAETAGMVSALSVELQVVTYFMRKADKYKIGKILFSKPLVRHLPRKIG